MIVKKFKTAKFFEVARIVSQCSQKKNSTNQTQVTSNSKQNNSRQKQTEHSTKESSSRKNSVMKNRNMGGSMDRGN